MPVRDSHYQDRRWFLVRDGIDARPHDVPESLGGTPHHEALHLPIADHPAIRLLAESTLNGVPAAPKYLPSDLFWGRETTGNKLGEGANAVPGASVLFHGDVFEPYSRAFAAQEAGKPAAYGGIIEPAVVYCAALLIGKPIPVQCAGLTVYLRHYFAPQIVG